MSDDRVVIYMSEAFRDSTLMIDVRVVRDWRFRLGFLLIRLGCRVLRCQLVEATPASGDIHNNE